MSNALTWLLGQKIQEHIRKKVQSLPPGIETVSFIIAECLEHMPDNIGPDEFRNVNKELLEAASVPMSWRGKATIHYPNDLVPIIYRKLTYWG